MDKFPGARYKSFSTSSEADEFLKGLTVFYFEEMKLTLDVLFFFCFVGSDDRPYHSYQTPYTRPAFDSRQSFSHSRSQEGYSNSIPVVYSDGCCYGNGKRGAEGGVGVFWGEDSPQ